MRLSLDENNSVMARMARFKFEGENMRMKIFIVALVLIGLAVLFFVPRSAAGDGKFEIKLNTTIQEILTESTGRRVVLKLESGDEVEGVVTMVGNNLVKISKNSGKEVYDSVISLNRISAVKIKMQD